MALCKKCPPYTTKGKTTLCTPRHLLWKRNKTTAWILPSNSLLAGIHGVSNICRYRNTLPYTGWTKAGNTFGGTWKSREVHISGIFHRAGRRYVEQHLGSFEAKNHARRNCATDLWRYGLLSHSSERLRKAAKKTRYPVRRIQSLPTCSDRKAK